MKTILTALLIVLLPLGAAAQTSGRVVDDQGRPVAYATVVALSLPDSAVLGGVTTDTTGLFRLPAAPRTALLRVSLVGYVTAWHPLKAGQSTVGNISLTPEGGQLGEATVTAVRPVARMKGDALVTTIEGTTLAKAGTAEDVLYKLPGIVVKDQKMEVVGKGAPTVYINGRQMRDANELLQLKSDEIRSVEVVRNPGAAYDATVAAVIRIRTVRRQGEGFGVDATADYSQGQYASGRGQLNMNYRHNDLDVFVRTDYNASKYFYRNDNDQTILGTDTWQQSMKDRTTSTDKNFNVTAGFNYDLSERHSFGLRYSLYNAYEDKAAGTFNADVLHNGVYYDHLLNKIASDADSDPMHQLNAYYVGQVGKGQLSVDADFYADGKSNAQTTAEQSAEHDDRLVASVNNVRNRLVAGKAKYDMPLLGGQFSVGTQYTVTDRHDDYLIPANDYGVNAARSQLKEQNAAGFAEYSRLTPIGQLTAGLRYEHVRFDYYEQHLRVPEQSRRYDNLFPSLSLATQLGSLQFMAAYTAKTQRPSYSQLSNNVTYGNRFIMQSGNPLLRPAVTHDLTLTGLWNVFQVMASYKHDRDGIIFWGSSLPDRPNVTKITYINKSYSNLILVVTAAPQVGLWKPTVTGVVQKQLLKMHVADGNRNFGRPIFSARVNNAFELPAGFLFNADFMYQGKGHYQNVLLSKPIYGVDVSLQRSFMNDALSVTVSGEDLFNQMKTAAEIHMENSVFTQIGRYQSRVLRLTVRYRFNAARSKYKGQGASGDEIRRFGTGR